MRIEVNPSQRREELLWVIFYFQRRISREIERSEVNGMYLPVTRIEAPCLNSSEDLRSCRDIGVPDFTADDDSMEEESFLSAR